MKRTQLYLDEEMAKTLATLSRQRGASISELVRDSLKESYGPPGKAADRAQIARSLAGIWRHRKDLGKTAAFLRRIRHGKRRRSLILG